MKHVVLRINGLVTEYLHDSEGSFVWKEQQAGRAEFNPEDARELAKTHHGLAVPVLTEPPVRRKQELPEPPDQPDEPILPTHPADGWATRWEREHDL